jgi:hypothetical protein
LFFVPFILKGRALVFEVGREDVLGPPRRRQSLRDQAGTDWPAVSVVPRYPASAPPPRDRVLGACLNLYLPGAAFVPILNYTICIDVFLFPMQVEVVTAPRETSSEGPSSVLGNGCHHQHLASFFLMTGDVVEGSAFARLS